METTTLKKSAEALLVSARAITRKAEDANRDLTTGEMHEVESILEHVQGIKAEIAVAEGRVIDGKVSGITRALTGPGGSLLSQFKSAGFVAGRSAGVVPFWGRKTASFDGDVEDLNPVRRDGVPLGVDQRYLFPVFPSVPVDSTTTSVKVLRQSSRTLATPADMIRDIDETGTKPETASVKELVDAPLNQVANVESGIPNIILASDGFAGMVQTDLRLAYEQALDALVVNAILNAGPDDSTQGDDLTEKIVYAAAVMADNGYNGTVVALSPGDYAALQLLRGADEQFARTDPLKGFTFRVTNAAGPNPLLLDPSAAGKLYVSAVTLQTFEESAGATNSSLVRLEGNALLHIERVDAILSIGAAFESSP